VINEESRFGITVLCGEQRRERAGGKEGGKERESRSSEHDIAKNVDTTRLREMSARGSSIVKLSLVQGAGFIEQSCRV